MQYLDIDASGWRSVDDFYDALCSAIRAPDPARARYSAVSFPTKPVAPNNTMSNSRGVAVTDPTLLDRQISNAGPKARHYLYV